MTTYLITTDNSPGVRAALLKVCTKVGIPGGLHDLLIVESAASILTLKSVQGVIDVEEDGESTVDDNNDNNNSIQQLPSNWFLPALSRTPEQYRYEKTGKGVDIYILDSGVNYKHPEFENRVVNLWSFDNRAFGDGVKSAAHGTMCASCAGGKEHGAAKEVTIVNVRFDFKYSTTIKALDIILKHHIDKAPDRPSILSMSFSGVSKSAHKKAIATLIDNGIVCMASTGNSGEPYSRFPAGNDIVIGVSALEQVNNDVLDLRPAGYSNYNLGTDVWAPGNNGVAAAHDSNGTQKASGTSAACPVAAGVMAMHLEGTLKLVDRKGVVSVLEQFLSECTRDTPMTGKYAQSTTKLVSTDPNGSNEHQEKSPMPLPVPTVRPPSAQKKSSNARSKILIGGVIVAIILAVILL